MTGSTLRARMDALIERLDPLMLWLAGAAIAIYLIELTGFWSRHGLGGIQNTVSLLIDLIFALDLFFKVWVQRGKYLRSPWFLIDLLSSLPILSAFAFIPSVESLRLMRGVRLFRILRVLRTLRMLRSLRILSLNGEDSSNLKEQRRFNLVLSVSVFLYTLLFLGLVLHLQSNTPEGEVVAVGGVAVDSDVEIVIRSSDGQEKTVSMARNNLFRSGNELEFYLVLGSILGMILILIIARAQQQSSSSQQLRALLNIALPHQVAEHYWSDPDAYKMTVRMPATIIFCDLEGFTSTVETLGNDLDTLKKHLEAALGAVVSEHRKQDLIVDKFIGDAIMSFRGGDLVKGSPSEHAHRVVRATLDGLRALKALNDPFFKHMRVGGASAPDALIGAFGTPNRLSYTILGDRVNLAARLESACKATHTDNLFCSQTYQMTRDCEDIRWRRIGRVRVQGKQEDVTVYEAFDPFSGDDFGWIDVFHRGLDAFQEKSLEAAQVSFLEADRLRLGGDSASRHRATLCADLLLSTLPPDWSPVLETRK